MAAQNNTPVKRDRLMKAKFIAVNLSLEESILKRLMKYTKEKGSSTTQDTLRLAAVFFLEKNGY